jgi:hypothetical protein
LRRGHFHVLAAVHPDWQVELSALIAGSRCQRYPIGGGQGRNSLPSAISV